MSAAGELSSFLPKRSESTFSSSLLNFCFKGGLSFLRTSWRVGAFALSKIAYWRLCSDSKISSQILLFCIFVLFSVRNSLSWFSFGWFNEVDLCLSSKDWGSPSEYTYSISSFFDFSKILTFPKLDSCADFSTVCSPVTKWVPIDPISLFFARLCELFKLWTSSSFIFLRTRTFYAISFSFLIVS